MIRSGTILDIDVKTLGRLAGEGWHWWINELSAMLPHKLRKPAQKIRGPIAHWTADSGLAADASDSAGPVTVAIDPGLVLTRTLERPLLALNDLKRAVALDIDRLTPFRADSVYCDAIIAGPGTTPGTMQSRIAAIPRSLGEDIAAAATGRGLTVAAAGLSEDGGESLTFDFAPALRRDQLLPATNRSRAFWWGLVALGFAINLSIFVYRDIESVRSLEALVTDQSLAANAARKLAASIQAEEQVRRDLATQRRRGDALGTLALTSRVLPAGVWVQRLSWDGAQLRISGYKPANSDVLKPLRDSGRFAAIRTTAADVATESSDGQPFDITAQLVAAP